MESSSSDENSQPSKSETSAKSEVKKAAEPAKTQPATGEGKLSRNPFINFIRYFRATHKGLSPSEVLKQGAVEWKKMSDTEKQKYIQEANKAPKTATKRKHRSPSSPSSLSSPSSPSSIESSTDSETSVASTRVSPPKKKRGRPAAKTNKARTNKARTTRLGRRKPQPKKRRIIRRRRNN